jgi:hypothetical protein
MFPIISGKKVSASDKNNSGVFSGKKVSYLFSRKMFRYFIRNKSSGYFTEKVFDLLKKKLIWLSNKNLCFLTKNKP